MTLDMVPPRASEPQVQNCMLCGSSETEHVFTKDGFELRRCRHCDLVFVANPPTSAELGRFYSFDEGYHSKFAAADADMSAEVAMARRHLAALKRFKTKGKLLDIGCSVGLFLNEARDAGWEVGGIERSPDTAEIGRRRFGLNIATGSLTENACADRDFDAITMWDVIEHLEDPLPALQKVHEMLAADGVLLLETPNVDGLFPRLSYQLAAKLDYWPHPEPPGHLFQFSKRTLSRLLEAAGLQIVNIDDCRIPLSYTFGKAVNLLASPKRLAYAIAFAPLAIAGPMLRQGDSIIVAAVKR